MANGGTGRGDAGGSYDGVLDALWQAQYGGRSPGGDPDGGTAQHATLHPGYSPFSLCATSDRLSAKKRSFPVLAKKRLAPVSAPDRQKTDPSIGIGIPATGLAVDAGCAPGDLLPGRGGWTRLQDDRRKLKAAMTGAQLQVIGGGSVVRILQPHKAAQRDRYRVTGGVGASPQPVGGKAGRVVVGMSHRSRRRMLELLHSLRSDGVSPLWITLTFPADFPDTPAARVAFTTFLKRLARKFPAYAAVWRIEKQKRGAPHDHLLMWGVVDDGQRLRAVKAWMTGAWHDIAGGGDAWHSTFGCKVTRVSHDVGVRRYIGKYQTKKGGELPGRSWGVVGRHLLPVGRVIAAAVSATVARDLVRLVRRACKVSMPRRGAGGVLTGRWLKRSPRLAADHGATRWATDPAMWIAAAAHLAGASPRGSDLAMLQRADAALLDDAMSADRALLDAVQLVARGALWRSIAAAAATSAGAAGSQPVKVLQNAYKTPIGSQTRRAGITGRSQTRQRVLA